MAEDRIVKQAIFTYHSASGHDYAACSIMRIYAHRFLTL